MKRALIYARLSREDKERAGTAAESTATQIHYGRRAADEQRWQVVGEVVDDGISGAEVLNRPGLQRALAEARAGACDVLVVRDLDRLARDALRQAALLAELTDAGVEVYQYSESAVAAVNGLGYAVTAMKGVVAEMERAQTAKRCREKTERIVELGGAPGRAPYGYRLVRADGITRYEPVPDQIAVVLDVGRRFVASGGVLRATARSLNAAGILSPSGRPWVPARIDEVLRRPVYRGVLRWGARTTVYERGTAREVRAPAERVLQAQHPELRVWPDELLGEIDTLLARPRRAFGAGTARYLASGIVTCAVCGQGICGKGHRRAGWYYVCGLHAKAGTEACRGIGNRRVDLVDDALLGALQPFLAGRLADRAIEIVRERLEAEADGTAPAADEAALRRRLADVEHRVRRLTDAIALGDAPEPLVARLRSESLASDELRAALGRVRQREAASIDVARGVRAARERLRQLRAGAREGGLAARPVLRALLGAERIRAVPVREDGQLRWHMTAPVGAGWLVCNVVRHPAAWRPPLVAPHRARDLARLPPARCLRKRGVCLRCSTPSSMSSSSSCSPPSGAAPCSARCSRPCCAPRSPSPQSRY